MADFAFLTRSEQMASHLTGELMRGHWSGTMPGVPALAADLGVDRKTVALALTQLERDGLLVGQGPGRPRKIVLSEKSPRPALRVQILLYEKSDATRDFMLDLLHQLQHAGHRAGYASKTLLDLKMDAKQVSRFVRKSEADAWVVQSGSREVLQWFGNQHVPAFAFAGRVGRTLLASAGAARDGAIAKATRRLIELGHRRIVLLVREERRKPSPGLGERRFLRELEDQGISSGSYNIPDWEDTKAGFGQCLDSLFQLTPPTALLIDEPKLFIAAQHHLAQYGIVAPRDVSLICLDPDPIFAWCEPAISLLKWDSRPWLRAIVRWANNVAHGKDDRRRTLTKSEFVEGGTVGKVPAVV